MYCSAFIIVGKPWTPSVSAGFVVTLMMFAPGAIECAHSTSRAVSSAQMLRVYEPAPLDPAGAALTTVVPFQNTCWNVGAEPPQLAPASPHMCGRPIWVSNTPRTEAMLGPPNEPMLGIVWPRPSCVAPYH